MAINMDWWTFLIPPAIGVALSIIGLIVCERFRPMLTQTVLMLIWAAVVGSLLTMAAIQVLYKPLPGMWG